ncbi:MAG: HEAT repeat domain-containing protein, partial [Longimicrobiales bacterium]
MLHWRPIRPERLIPVLVLAAACAPRAVPVVEPPPPPPAPATTSVILDESSIAAIAELLRMEDRRLLDSVRISGLLSHPEPQVRGRAALAAGRIGDRRATPLLVAALSDSSAFVRASGAFALGELGDSSAAVIDALATLVQSETQDSVAVEAVGALGRLGTERARPPLLTLLEERPATNGDSAFRTAASPPVQEALLVIWRLPRTASAVRAVRGYLDAPDADTRWRATFAIMRFADPGTVDLLLSKLHDAEPLVRSLAARGLRATVVDSAG